MMSKAVKKLFSYTIYMGSLVFLLACAMVISACIPQKAIQQNMEESAAILAERPTTLQILPGINSSKVHPYADMLTLNIAYHFGDEVRKYDGFNFFEQFRYTNAEKLKAVMWTKYYGTPEDTDESIKLFKKSVDNRLRANKEYLRYWHGSAGIIRFLHIFLNIREIYILHTVFLIALLIYLGTYLIRNHYLREAVALVISLVMVSIWFVPICLEYYWCFLVMTVVSIISVKIADKGEWQKVILLFFLTGIITAYLDFLTTETVTLVVPLLLMMSIRWRGQNKNIVYGFSSNNQGSCVPQRLIPKTCFSWLAGFCLMWVSKWILAALILQENVLPYVTAHIEERIGGDSNGKSQATYAIGAVGRNLRCLLPFDYGRFGYFVLGVLTGIAVTMITARIITFDKAADRNKLVWYFAIGCIPIVRYMVLHNHAWFHRSFTYRGLAGSILAMCFMLTELFKKQEIKMILSDSTSAEGGGD